MSKKQIFILILVVLIVSGIAIGGLYFYKKKNDTIANLATNSVTEVAGTQTLDLNQAKSNTVPLGGESQKEEPGSGLSVSSSAPTNSAQLGSGYRSSNNSGNGSNSSSSNNSVPGPESFGQYEQYKTSQTSLFGDIQVGNGNPVTNGKKVAVVYKGYLTNGQLFDENTDANKPFVFTPGAGQVIRGWEESIPGMKVGGIRRIIVPPTAGYGATAQGKIPPNSVLVFDVQVLAVE